MHLSVYEDFDTRLSVICIEGYNIYLQVYEKSVVLFVLVFYGPINNEVMSSRSVNSDTVPGQA